MPYKTSNPSVKTALAASERAKHLSQRNHRYMLLNGHRYYPTIATCMPAFACLRFSRIGFDGESVVFAKEYIHGTGAFETAASDLKLVVRQQRI